MMVIISKQRENINSCNFMQLHTTSWNFTKLLENSRNAVAKNPGETDASLIHLGCSGEGQIERFISSDNSDCGNGA